MRMWSSHVRKKLTVRVVCGIWRRAGAEAAEEGAGPHQGPQLQVRASDIILVPSFVHLHSRGPQNNTT